MNLNSSTVIFFVATLMSVSGLCMIGLWALKTRTSRKNQKRLSVFVKDKAENDEDTAEWDSLLFSGRETGKMRNWVNSNLAGVSSQKMQIKLSSAYWPITDTEFTLIRFFSTVIAFILGWMIPSNILGGFLFGAITVMIPPILLDRSIGRRQSKFQSQLLDVLVLIKGAVQAGYGLMQALSLAVEEIPAPASQEFGQVLHEIRLGNTLESALTNLVKRMESDDLQIVVTAIIINNQVGSSLSTVLEAAISTIRDRMQLLGEIRSLTSYARYVGNFLTLMPFITGIIIMILSPGHFDTVKTSMLAQLMFAIAFVGIIIGNMWIRQIVKIKV